jgi:hypothetical protein
VEWRVTSFLSSSSFLGCASPPLTSSSPAMLVSA